jgi:hypothetical protein
VYDKWQDILVGSSANTFVVLYQYTIPPARPHLTAALFQLLDVLCGGAVVRYRDPSRDVGVARGAVARTAVRNSVRDAGRYMMCCDKGNANLD